MNTSEDEPSSGLNGRLRPRRSTVTSPHTNKATRKPEPKTATERQKRTSTPSKASTTKPDDLANKSESTSTPQLLCPYCDRKFASKQTLSQHARRVHLSKDAPLGCLYCNHAENDSNDIIRHMVDSHPNQYFACLDCHTRFPSTSELAEHKLNVCEKQKVPYRSKLRQKVSSGAKKTQKSLNVDDKGFRSDGKNFADAHRFNGVVIACELKPSQVSDEADIEDNITTNLILPPSKSLGSSSSMEKNAVIVLDDIQWNKRMPTNFSFHNTDADQILSRLGVVHRSPRTGESTKKDWFKCADEVTQKFEKCFDTSFYSKVASNVHENMSKFLDGSFNFNPDPDSIIKTRKSKFSVPINAAEGFPILLACEQYSRNVFDGYLPRALAPKHKWKWENEKAPLNPDDIKHDTHVNNCIITLVSSLDIWTQLCMRRKFEEKFSIAPLEKKTEKQNTISKELKEILESRELPSSSRQVMKFVNKPMPAGDSLDFPATLGLKPSSSAPSYDVQPAVLSGEWVRPRCYVCCACGAQTRDSRGLSSHISSQHPNAQVQHYEIVGELLLNADILKHLYVPPSQMSNRTRPLRGFRECTKCKKSISLEDLHQHMLDCAGDTPAVRRKCRYRPFGVRRRRTRLPDNTIRKKIRKDIRTRQTRQKTHMRPRPKIRTEVGDAETIRKMLADLPAKRHRVMVNPTNSILRPRRKLDKQRNTLLMKRRSSDILKNRKQRSLMRNSVSKTASNSGDNDDNDAKSNNKSDDDNKPLKPKVKTMKFKRSTRQSEALKRKVAMNRAKRRAQIKEQKAIEDKLEPAVEAPVTSSVKKVEQLSIYNTPQRIDVSGGPYNTREHSSRGRANNRDDQRPGPSSQDGNTHSSYTPPQNAPLKHSIARLTADSDMHENNVPFHHLYLMQTECNEVTHHVPTGQQRLFENEAVVTKLDKPPLHFSPTGSVDPFACQKSKQCSTSNNKRKGLNDCIAMLKNKAGQTSAEAPESTPPCSTDERSSSEPIATNQISPNSDFQTNYDANTRPAEVFSRHQFIRDTFIEYRPESNLIAQNFADLPFHYLPSQRLPFDLPQPDGRIDPRFVKPSKYKQNEGNQKAPRRRSTRAEKEQMKRQDYLLRTSPAHFAVNVLTPSKVGGPQSRRASTQSVAVSTNAAVNKRRSSVSYNQSRKTTTDYRNEAMLPRQRQLEYLPQQVSPEARLLELNQSEAYIEAQKNFQNQMIACAENYINKKQLAISVDTNYSNKKPNTLSPEAVYMASKQTVSPGSSYINKKQAALGSDGSHLSKHKHPQDTSPGEGNYMKKKQAASAKESNYFPKQPFVTTGEIAYNKEYAASALETDLISKTKAATYIESAYVNKKAQAISAESNCSSKVHTAAFNEKILSKSPVIDPQNNTIDHDNFVSPPPQSVNETNLVAKKQTSVTNDRNLTPKTSPVAPEETNFITKKRAATSESSFKKQLATSDSTGVNKPVSSSEITLVNKNQAAASDVFLSKKQAVALENNLNKNLALPPESITSKRTPMSESSFENNAQSIPKTNCNILDNKLPDVRDEVYPESAFKTSPPNIPPAYPTVDTNFQSSTPETEAPLDLSKSTSKENTEMPGKGDPQYDTDSFDNYETLDLSHKSSEHDNDEINDVVDLRVKVSATILDMSSKLHSVDDMDSATDLSIKARDDIPTDLTVRRKTDNAYEYDTQNVNYDEVHEFVQDLRKTQPEEQPLALSTNIGDPNIPTDLSGRGRDIPVHKVVPQTLAVQTHMDNIPAHVGNINPADLSVKEKLTQNGLLSVTPKQHSPMIGPVLNKQTHQSKSSNVMDCVQPRIVDECASKALYDVNVNQSMYTTPKTATIAATAQGSIVAGTVRSSNALLSRNMDLEKKQVKEVIACNAASFVSTSSVTINCSSVTNTISCEAPSLQLYSISKTVVPLTTEKYECTTPVYTLSNSCAPMSRTESSYAVPISEGILSNSPKMSSASATSIYTTDATCKPTVHHMQVLDKSSQHALSATIQSICNTQISSDLNLTRDKNIRMVSDLQITKSSAQEQNKEMSNKCGDLDPETAKKIAMLPKELVEILGTMPVDHRNQLLNVLPQYVSAPAAASQNDSSNNLAATNTLELNKTVSPVGMSESDVKPTFSYSPVSSSQSLRSSLIDPVSAASVACTDKVAETNSRPHYDISRVSPPEAVVGNNLSVLPRMYEIDGNTVIDLTEDEPANADVKKNILEPNNSDIIPSNELGSVGPNNLLNKQKVNDQTASLRAVRIKAPSERNKSLSMDSNTGLKITGQDQHTKTNVLYMPEIDINVDKAIDLDKTLAIQQAEISSTQHNTSMAGHCKYPLAISPSSTEYSGDESSKHVTQPSPIPVSEIVSKNVEENNYETPLPKTGTVTSSISANIKNRSNADNNLNPTIDTNTLALPKPCDVADDDPELISKSKDSDFPKCEVITPDADMTQHVEDSAHRTKETESEEDSEDDMCLAAIIKQKLRGQPAKTCEINIGNLKKKKPPTKRKKKAKKVTQKTARDEIFEDIPLNEIKELAPTCAESLVHEENNLESNITSQVAVISEDPEMDKNARKRPKRGRRPAKKPGAIPLDEVQKIESDKDINKENDVVSKLINNNADSAHAVPVDVKCAIKEPSPHKHDVIDDDDVQIEAPHVKNELRVNRKSLNEKDVAVTISKINNSSTKKGPNKSRGKMKRLDFTEAVPVESVDQSEKEQIKLNELEQDLEPMPIESTELNSELKTLEQETESQVNKKSRRPARSKKQKLAEIEKNEQEDKESPQIPADIEIKKDVKTPTPLRRSTRGKSLYLENSVTDHDLTENTLVQKTPLTKKQLILSKLRQDEYTPKAHSTPEKHSNESEVQDPNTKQVIDNPEQSTIENSCEIADEKPKGRKRRNSSNIPKRSKKKKSIEERNEVMVEIDTDDSENIHLNSENPSNKKLSESSEEFNAISNDNPQSPELISYKKSTDANAASTEKRKIDNNISFDFSHSSKPKKTKMTKNNKNLDSDSTILNTKKDFNTTSIPTETKTACYNVQVPARRPRSKSAVVKSAELSDYDPYDINLEVMAEQNESGKKNLSASKNSKKKTAKETNILENSKHKKDNLKNNTTLDFQEDTKILSDYDSDDSTRSDVPLQKYIEEKEKKNKVMEVVPKEKESKTYKELKNTEEKRRSSSASDKIPENVTQDDEDEQAEKFMQSFGFFSEKKPRKSNILATKKISETINITNESDDRYFGFKNRSSKKNAENKKVESESKAQPQPSTSKRGPTRRGRKKKVEPERKIFVIPRACETCSKNFRRSDNYLRHILSSLYHVSKFSEAELKIKTQPVQDGPNYLVAYKLNLERYKNLIARHAELKNRSAKAAARITMPTHAEFIEDVKVTIAELEVLAKRALSQDEALFLDCCELLKGVSKGSFLDHFDKALNEEFAKLRECDDDDVDSITAQNILESEEVRNLENDLISGLKEAALASRDSKPNQDKTNDVAQSLVEMGQAAIPQVTLLQLAIPEVAIPQAELSQLDNPQVEPNEMAISQDPISQDQTIPKVPEVARSETAVSEATMLDLEIPKVSVPQIMIPQATLPEEAQMSPLVQIDQMPVEDVGYLEQAEEEMRDCDLTDMRQESEFQEIHEKINESLTKESNQQISIPVVDDSHYESIDEFDIPIKSKMAKAKKQLQGKDKHMEIKYIEIKEKMYPDIIEDIDMFEDKFDKIKRKCRSQAAAAKQPQPVIEPTTSNKGRKKSEKKKGKRGSKKGVQQNTQVPTKGALKGFDGIKVSIPTSDINLSSIVPVYESSPKKKKRSGSKRKKEKKHPESSYKYDSDHRAKDSSSDKKVDVYEFMDNEDAECFELRPSTLMERFKMMCNNRDVQSTSKGNTVVEDDASSDSASDGDDFVYMSDDYVCSDDETENSIMSCEINNAKIGNDVKKITPQKRKDAVEKNAVMGKIFKHNALRTEKKIPVIKVPEPPKADLDQLFDSLLEEEPNSSILNNEPMSPKDEVDDEPKTKYDKSSKCDASSTIPDDQTSIDDSFFSSQEPFSPCLDDSEMTSSDTMSKRRNSIPSKDQTSRKQDTRASKNYDPSQVNYGASTSKQYEPIIDYGPSTSKKYDNVSPKDYKRLSPKSYDPIPTDKYEEKFRHHEPKIKKRTNSSSYNCDNEAFKSFDDDAKILANKPDEGISTSFDLNAELFDQSMDEDAGVARHRARRKCTVGKQNVLAETWSSESEPDGAPPRPNSAESVLSHVGRKKKGRKRDGQQASGRRGNTRQGYKKQDIESRVSSSRAACASVAPVSVLERRASEGATVEVASEAVGGSSVSDKAAAAMPAPSTSHGRGRRAAAHYWSPADAAQQHGWIVGDSHKKVVTMLVNIKGRKRNDDKRHLVE